MGGVTPPRRDRLAGPRLDLGLGARRLLVVALVAVLAACSGGDDDAAPRPTTSTTGVDPAWAELAGQAFEPLASSSAEVPGAVRAWLDGALADDALRETLDVALASSMATTSLVGTLPDAPAKALYLASAQLHVQHVRIHLRGIDLEPGAMREQVALLGLRVRQLGDRVFDRGRALIGPTFGADEPEVQLNLPEEVPDWEDAGLAVGPPLDSRPGPPASTPALRADERPTQAERGWLAAVEAAGAPGEIDLDGDLAAQARDYVDAAEALGDEPDPDGPGGRERSALLRLSWLVKADAARAAQAGLPDIARDLDAITISP